MKVDRVKKRIVREGREMVGMVEEELLVIVRNQSGLGPGVNLKK